MTLLFRLNVIIINDEDDLGNLNTGQSQKALILNGDGIEKGEGWV